MQHHISIASKMVSCLVLTLGFHGSLLAQTGWTSCNDLEQKRLDSASKSDWAELNSSATQYFQQCRTSRSKAEISMAMGEIATVLRVDGKFNEALTKSQDCIRYEYLALGCHIEKAISMNGLGMKTEAKEVLKTARQVLGQLADVANHEFEVAEVLRRKPKGNEYEIKVRSARARLVTADRIGLYLKIVEKSMGVS